MVSVPIIIELYDLVVGRFSSPLCPAAFICSSREHLTHGPDLLWFGPFLLYSMPCARTEKWNLKRVQDDGCAGTKDPEAEGWQSRTKFRTTGACLCDLRIRPEYQLIGDFADSGRSACDVWRRG